MQYEEFKKDFENWLKCRYNGSSRSVLIFDKGFKGESEEERLLVRDTNRKHFHSESVILKGDIAIVASIEEKLWKNIIRFNISDVYDTFKKRKYSWEWIKPYVESNEKLVEEAASLEEVYGDFEKAKNRLIVRLVNLSMHKTDLEHCVWKRIGDMAQVLYFQIIAKEDNLVSLKVPGSFLTQWGLKDDEIWSEALDNTAKLSSPRLYLNEEDAVTRDKEKGIFMGPDFKLAPISGKGWAPFLTTWPCTNGATAILYKGVADRIAEMCSGDFLIGFLSVHECRIHPERYAYLKKIARMVRSVGAMFPEDILTRMVFRYDAQRGVYWDC